MEDQNKIKKAEIEQKDKYRKWPILLLMLFLFFNFTGMTALLNSCNMDRRTIKYNYSQWRKEEAITWRPYSGFSGVGNVFYLDDPAESKFTLFNKDFEVITTFNLEGRRFESISECDEKVTIVFRDSNDYEIVVVDIKTLYKVKDIFVNKEDYNFRNTVYIGSYFYNCIENRISRYDRNMDIMNSVYLGDIGRGPYSVNFNKNCIVVRYKEETRFYDLITLQQIATRECSYTDLLSAPVENKIIIKEKNRLELFDIKSGHFETLLNKKKLPLINAENLFFDGNMIYLSGYIREYHDSRNIKENFVVMSYNLETKEINKYFDKYTGSRTIYNISDGVISSDCGVAAIS